MSTIFKSHARLSGALRTIYTGKEMSFSLLSQHPCIGVAGYKVLIENENTGGCFLGSSTVSGHHRYSTGKKCAGKGLGSCDRRLRSTTMNRPESQQTIRAVGQRVLRLIAFQPKTYSSQAEIFAQAGREGWELHRWLTVRNMDERMNAKLLRCLWP